MMMLAWPRNGKSAPQAPISSGPSLRFKPSMARCAFGAVWHSSPRSAEGREHVLPSVRRPVTKAIATRTRLLGADPRACTGCRCDWCSQDRRRRVPERRQAHRRGQGSSARKAEPEHRFGRHGLDRRTARRARTRTTVSRPRSVTLSNGGTGPEMARIAVGGFQHETNNVLVSQGDLRRTKKESNQ